MAQALNKTKRRIVSVSNTKKITEAMELVATVKLKKFKGQMERNQTYSVEMENLIFSLFATLNDDIEIDYLKENKIDKNLVIVINSNLGLCASYNTNIVNYVLNNLDKSKDVIVPIGIKGMKIFKRTGFETIDTFVNINEKISYDECVKLTRFIQTEFKTKNYRTIKILYTKYINSLRFEPILKTLLPLNKKEGAKKIGYEPIFDSDIKTLVEELVPIYLTSNVYQSIIESQVSEQASRRTAMENANDNADEIIDKLTLEFNKARQAAITQEITEVVASRNE